ncbi:MAG: hydrogenase nickel incorporation protein HypB [Veillonella sp.]|nr:hydrogenase nickel incorporation protein HypB [Veillonella sp.]
MQVQVKTNVLAKNDAIAEALQQLFKKKNIFVFNLLGSPGAGKTSLLEATLQDLKKEYRLAVIEGDLFTAKDAKRIHELGVPVIQINTVGGCHLDAQMIQDALGDLNLDDLDMIIIENVGNLVCPAEFEIGESMKVTVLSVTEGEDKPLKYPLIFKESKAILINKIDLLPYVTFKKEQAIQDIRNLNPNGEIFEVSCTAHNGLEPWLNWLRAQLENNR